MRRAPLFAAWGITLAALAGLVAWIQLGEAPPRDEPPAVLTLVIPDRPAKPAADAPAPAEAPPAEATPPEPAQPEPAQPEPAKPDPVASEPAPAAPAPMREAQPEPAPIPAAPSPAAPAPDAPASAGSAPAAEAAPPAQPSGFHGVDPRLVEDGPHGPLPIVDPLGRRPWQVYARPFAPTAARPRVALVVTDLGLGAAATRRAVERLPPDVSLAFLSYADDAAVWLQRARAEGHEVMLAVPMEPAARTDDPGPRPFTADSAPDGILDLLDWHLSRGSAYVGLTTFMGGRFLASESAMRTFLAPLRDRGLLFFDASADAASTAARAARDLGVPFAAADRVVDPVPSRAAVERRLADLEELARSRGSAVGVGHPYPVTIDAVAAWAAGLSERGVDLAPLSAVVGAVGGTTTPQAGRTTR